MFYLYFDILRRDDPNLFGDLNIPADEHYFNYVPTYDEIYDHLSKCIDKYLVIKKGAKGTYPADITIGFSNIKLFDVKDKEEKKYRFSEGAIKDYGAMNIKKYKTNTDRIAHRIQPVQQELEESKKQYIIRFDVKNNLGFEGTDFELFEDIFESSSELQFNKYFRFDEMPTQAMLESSFNKLFRLVVNKLSDDIQSGKINLGKSKIYNPNNPDERPVNPIAARFKESRMILFEYAFYNIKCYKLKDKLASPTITKYLDPVEEYESITYKIDKYIESTETKKVAGKKIWSSAFQKVLEKMFRNYLKDAFNNYPGDLVNVTWDGKQFWLEIVARDKHASYNMYNSLYNEFNNQNLFEMLRSYYPLSESELDQFKSSTIKIGSAVEIYNDDNTRVKNLLAKIELI